MPQPSRLKGTGDWGAIKVFNIHWHLSEKLVKKLKKDTNLYAMLYKDSDAIDNKVIEAAFLWQAIVFQ